MSASPESRFAPFRMVAFLRVVSPLQEVKSPIFICFFSLSHSFL